MTIMQPPESGVRVRMYRTGVGDCLLLAFRKRDGGPFYLLIDCGIHSQWRGGSDKIRKVVEHIRDSTNNHLDVVVVTHEHGDHVSGFYVAKDIFQHMTSIDQVWFGWTEDPENELAQRLDRHRSLMMNALRAARRTLAANDPVAQNVNHLLGFFEVPASGGLSISSRDARDAIRDLGKEARYLKPKVRPLTLPEVEGVRIFVLGPAEDEGWLMRARPSREPGEVYEDESEQAFHLSSDDALSYALMAAADEPLDPEGTAKLERAQPFAGNQRVAEDIVRANKELYRFFHDHYGFRARDSEAWRRIETNWINPADSLALKLDSATNNTSLVLAFELQESKRVLLFPGDAQVGNWKSWHEGGWDEHNGLRPGETIIAKDLLERTVLYKVGHHGSHNATLRRQGLEMMRSPELAAMIPVHEEWAHKRRPYPWKMPFHPLYEDLQVRTQGRILRSDLGRVVPERPSSAWQRFKDCSRVEDLYVELDVPDSTS
jgi:hypothetical protein